MPLVGFTCPADNKPISFEDCKNKCRYWNGVTGELKRCFPLPVLQRMSLGEKKPVDMSKIDEAKFSTTQLINDVHYEALRQKTPYYQSPYGLVWVIMGSGYHWFLQKDMSNCLQEQYLEDEICTGMIDLYSDEILWDYKFLGTFKIKMLLENLDANGEEYFKQLNRYRVLLEKTGFKVNKIIMVVFARDFRRYEFDRDICNVGKFKKDGNPYSPPIYPCHQFEIPIVDFEDFFKDQRDNLKNNLKIQTTSQCSSIFRWSSDKRCHSFCPVNKESCEYYKQTYMEVKNGVS